MLMSRDDDDRQRLIEEESHLCMYNDRCDGV